MKTLHKVIVLIILFTSIISTAQEKLKGNREVTTINRAISEFNKIEVIDNLKVELVYGETQEISVKTDSNLQNAILTDVVDGTLIIKTSAKITRKKELTVIIKVNKNLNEIYTYNNAKILSYNSLKIDSLIINAFDNSDFNIQLSSNFVKINAKKTTDLKIDALCNTLIVKCEESSNLKGNYNSKIADFQLTGKSSITASGNIEEAKIETSKSSIFKGRKLEIQTAEVRASESSDIYVNCLEEIDIYTKNTSEVTIYSNPKITLSEFFDKSSLHKKEIKKELF